MSPRISLLTCAAILAAATALKAQTFSFVATVDSLETLNPGGTDYNGIGLIAGNTLTGTISFDRTTPDYHPDNSQLGTYYNSSSPDGQPGLYVSTLTLDLPGGSIIFGTKPASAFGRFIETSVIQVADGAPLNSPSGKFGSVSGDSLNFYHKIDDSITGSYTINRVDTVEMLLNDSTGTAFGSDQLPTALDLANFNLAKIYYYKSNGASLGPSTSNLRTEAITASITSLTAVPEPSSLAISAIAGISLLGIRRRRTW